MEQDAKLSGFNSFLTARSLGFNEINTSEFERIFQALISSPEFVNIQNFFTKLDTHLRSSPDAHHGDIKSLEKAILKQLFVVYRDNNFTGSIKDMLFSIVKDITIATDTEVEIGTSSTVAITAQQWKELWNEHEQNLSSHYRSFDDLRLKNIFNKMPVIYFTKSFSQDYEIYGDDGYTPYDWNNAEGTLVLDFNYDTKFPYELMVFHFLDSYVNENKVAATKSGELMIRVVPHDRMLYVTEVVAGKSANVIPIHMTFDSDIGSDRIVISYDRNGLFVRNPRYSVTSEYTVFTHDITSLKFQQPFKKTNQSSIASINEFIYYNRSASKEEAVFLLN